MQEMEFNTKCRKRLAQMAGRCPEHGEIILEVVQRTCYTKG